MNEDTSKELPIKVGTKSKTIHVDYLARVEGEGSLYIKTQGNQVEDVQLKIFEPPRFFEALLKGRSLFEAPDITARICGICPVAYQMSAVYAMESALGIEVPEYIHRLRRLIYCGEWIESHTLHIYMLHAPDFLGCKDAVEMAKKDQEILKRGLRIKKAGNEIIKLLGGREVHPINVKVGGFYMIPEKAKLLALSETLKKAYDDALQSLLWVSKLPFPHIERDFEFLALHHDKEYPMARGTLKSSSGISFSSHEYEKYCLEHQVEHSTALHAVLKDKGEYLVGPVARYNLNRDNLPQSIQKIIEEIGFEKRCINPFRSIIVRSIEVLFALQEALDIIKDYDAEQLAPNIKCSIKPSTGFSATEAPRGLLYNKYIIGSDGLIQEAKIIPPTSQNQKLIEKDLYHFVKENISLSDQELQERCEMAVRNFDPCISCSTHFLKMRRDRV